MCITLALQFLSSVIWNRITCSFSCMSFHGFSFQELQGRIKMLIPFYLTQKNVYSISKFPGFFVWLVFFPLDNRIEIFFRNSSFEYLVITIVFNWILWQVILKLYFAVFYENFFTVCFFVYLPQFSFKG